MRRKVAYVDENKPLYGYMSVEHRSGSLARLETAACPC
jgi:hypothetical protein